MRIEIILQSAIIFTVFAQSVSGLSQQEIEDQIIFYGWNSNAPTQRFISTFNTTITDQGCDPNGKFAMIVHGWAEGIVTPWAPITVSNLLQYRGGCVFFMDFSKFANVSNYYYLTPYFASISAVLLKKIQHIGHNDQMYMFGFSFGSRLCMDAGTTASSKSGVPIDRMDLCEPAGPGFDQTKDPKPAAKNVACINTSYNFGTYVYNCHQNFRMGDCGWALESAGTYPIGSHGTCPYLYNLAFDHNFVFNNYYSCTSDRLVVNPTSDVKMGYMGNFNRTAYVGDIFVATAKYPPYIIENNVLNNQVESLMREYETCLP